MRIENVTLYCMVYFVDLENMFTNPTCIQWAIIVGYRGNDDVRRLYECRNNLMHYPHKTVAYTPYSMRIISENALYR